MGVPFVGRTGEVRTVLRALVDAPGHVTVTGQSGVGKSRLLAEVAAQLDTQGWRVVSLSGYDAARHIPMGALASLLPAEPPDSEALLIAHVLRTIVAEAGDDRRVLACIDDSHLLDDASLALVAEMIRARECSVALAVTTPDEIPPTLERLLHADTMTHVELGPMPGDEILALAAEHLGAPLADDAGVPVVEAVRGLPLLLGELLTDAADSGTIHRVGECYVVDGELPVGARVTEVISSRVRRLPRELSDAMERLAVAEPVDFSLIRVDPDAARVSVLAELEERGLARVDNMNGVWTVRTAHALIGRAVRAAMPVSRRLEILGQLCRVVADREQLSPHAAMSAAAWFTEYGSPMPVHVSASAAWEALTALDVDSAVRLATPAARQHWRAAYVLAEVARWRNDAAAAEVWLAQAAVLAPDDDAVRRVALTRSALEAWQRQDPKAAITVLTDAAAGVNDPVLVDLLLCEAAFLATLWGEFDDAVLTARLLLAKDDLDPLSASTAGVNLCYAQVMLGSTDGLEQVVRRVQRSFGEVSSERPEGPDLVCAIAVGERMLAADTEGAVHTAVTELAELRRTGSPRGVCAALSADALLQAADPRAADVALEAVQQLRRHDPYNALVFGLGHAALMVALRGDAERAALLLTEVEERGVDARSRAIVGRAEAAALALQDPVAAAKLAVDSGVAAVAANHVSLGSIAVFEALFHGSPGDIAPVLADVCTGPDAPLMGRFREVAAGLVAGDQNRVLDVARSFEDSGARYLAAITLAASARADDDGLRARRSAARATAHTLRSGWLSAPVVDCQDPLSVREVEIAVLGADGLSNREIAERTFLSPRTVGNHLHHAYAKLGVDGREDLAPLLG
ncbi:LuxR C-terminal-related transcriptional regulator [Nocardioides sp. AE5]|uniref:helix-turn-helix transcriptional regulator n=1 Tax=Nocardioides sp. AE5 TaxID=2962573 RepID=UPI002882C4DF|nr:LuxR C-terminal-related transcriptional regulator [Nocardioides sp. AE5]MDT0203082.1 LuxR C-terminal-related transcriptional regulator [Nocardioides sp. AE5]